MLRMEGLLLNLYKANDFVDRETKQTVVGRFRIQMQVTSPLQSGESKIQLVDLTTDFPQSFKAHVGKTISVPVGAMVNQGSRQVQFFLPQGHQNDVKLVPAPGSQSTQPAASSAPSTPSSSAAGATPKAA